MLTALNISKWAAVISTCPDDNDIIIHKIDFEIATDVGYVPLGNHIYAAKGHHDHLTIMRSNVLW